jgi:hypothetical protein
VHQTHTDPQVGLVAVGFSPPDRLAAITRHLDWPGRTLADPQRELYGRLGIGRAPWWRVYSPGTLALYARDLARGHRPERPAEDTRQLGGDAVMVDGGITALWCPRTPDDRPAASVVLQAASELARASSPPGSGENAG